MSKPICFVSFIVYWLSGLSFKQPGQHRDDSILSCCLINLGKVSIFQNLRDKLIGKFEGNSSNGKIGKSSEKLSSDAVVVSKKLERALQDLVPIVLLFWIEGLLLASSSFDYILHTLLLLFCTMRMRNFLT